MRALDTKPEFCYRGKPCALEFDDVYILLAQRIKTQNFTNDFVRTIWDEVSWAIMNYINLPYVPCGLKSIVMMLMIDTLNFYTELLKDPNDSDGDVDIEVGSINSVIVGDTQIRFGGNESSDTFTSKGRALNSHKPDLDSMIFAYKDQLNQYRSLIPWRR